MELKDIAAVSGKSGLWKVLKPTRTGLILESMTDNKTRIVTGPHHRVSLLHEISIYTTDPDKTIPLEELLWKIKGEFDDDPGVDGKSDSDELRAFMHHIAPDHDDARVYTSDIKKIVNWYLALYQLAPELLEKPKEEKEVEKKEDKEKESQEQKPSAEKEKKPATKTAKKKPTGTKKDK